MRLALLRLPLRLVLALLGCAGAAAAQPSTGWRAYPAFNEVTAVTSDGETVWGGTSLGVFSYDSSTGELARFTPAEGLRGGLVQALAADARRGVLWIGYANGAIDRLDPATGTVARVDDIVRATQYPSRGVRRLRLQGDSLYIATDFGVVVYDAARNQVRNTYARLGALDAATPVNDVVQAPLADGRPGLWVATDDALVWAPLAAELQTPGAWSIEGPMAVPSYSLAVAEGRLYLGGGPATARDVYRRQDSGAWERLFGINVPIRHLISDGGAVLALSESVLYVARPGGQDATAVTVTGAARLRGVARTTDGRIWLGDAARGLLPIAADLPAGAVTVAAESVQPDGPFSNAINNLAIAPDGTVWLAMRQLASIGVAAVGRFDGSTWTNFRTDDPSLSINQGEFLGAAVDDRGRFYTGTFGNQFSPYDGLTVFTGGVPILYGVENSSIRGIPSDANFVVVSDVGFERDLRWVINQNALVQLHLFDGDDNWTALPTPSGIDVASRFDKIVIDGAGQKWISLDRNGLAVWDTGRDPANPADDRGRQFTAEGSNGQGLPSTTVNAVAVDGQGRVWLGTNRGIAYIFSPGSAFGSDPSLAQPQWPIVVGADGDGDDADWLLRDALINDLAVDPAGRIWVASSSGAFLINEEGNDLLRTITSANSPLPSDVVNRVAVDPVSGRVYFVTPSGLFSTDGDATRATPSSEALAVAPNPFRPAQHAGGVLVSGLQATATTVRILTVDGEVVHARDARGGSFRWDGRDDRTGQPVPSGVYLVAAASDDGTTIYGKVAVLR